MTDMLVQYDVAMSALSIALNSRHVDVVMKSRESLEFIKLRARQLNDRKLLADATEFHMRVERWLGALLIEEKKAGHLPEGRPRKCAPGQLRPISLKDAGISKHLSMKAQHAASLDQDVFDTRRCGRGWWQERRSWFRLSVTRKRPEDEEPAATTTTRVSACLSAMGPGSGW